MKNINVYKLQMVKEGILEYQAKEPEHAADIFRHLIGLTPEEIVCVLAVDNQSHVIAAFEVSHGDSSSSVVSMKSVFSRLLLAGPVAGFIICHNHTGESLHFSQEDIEVTKRLADCGAILNIPLLDHIVINSVGFSSAAAQGLI